MRTVALILILVVVVIILLILRRRRSKKKGEIMPSQEKTVQGSTSPDKPQGEIQEGEKENKI